MHFNTAFNHQQRAVSEVNDVMSRVRWNHASHERIMTHMTRIRATIAHCPRWVQSYIDGRIDGVYAYANTLVEYGVWTPSDEWIPASTVESRGMTWREFGELSTQAGGATGTCYIGTCDVFSRYPNAG